MDAAEASGSNSSSASASAAKAKREKDEVRVRRKALQAVLEQCQRALELLSDAADSENDDDDDGKGSSSPDRDPEIDELCDLIKCQVKGTGFLQKIEDAQASNHVKASEDGSTWDIVSKNDLWEAEDDGLEQEDYVLVRQEDIVDGIAGFMAAYLSSLKQTKILTPNQLQEALGKTLSIKRKGKLRKAWDGTQVIYNVASWSATAVGIYQNPALLRAATTAFWTSCQAISKLL